MPECSACQKIISNAQLNNHRAKCKKSKSFLLESLRMHKEMVKRNLKRKQSLNAPPRLTQRHDPPEDNEPMEVVEEV